MKIRLFILLGFALIFSGCATKMRTRGPVWYVPAEDTRVIGVGVNVFTVPTVTNSFVNGVRIEVIGPGIVLPLAPDTASPCWETREEYLANVSAPGENVYGLELSGTGTLMEGRIVGISLGWIGSIKNKVTGLVGTLGVNTARDVTGIQVGGHNTTYRTAGAQIGFSNRASELYGLQLGVFNGCHDGHGIQIGLLNANERRWMPIINWTWKWRDEIPNQALRDTVGDCAGTIPNSP